MAPIVAEPEIERAVLKVGNTRVPLVAAFDPAMPRGGVAIALGDKVPLIEPEIVEEGVVELIATVPAEPLEKDLTKVLVVSTAVIVIVPATVAVPR